MIQPPLDVFVIEEFGQRLVASVQDMEAVAAVERLMGREHLLVSCHVKLPGYVEFISLASDYVRSFAPEEEPPRSLGRHKRDLLGSGDEL